jgi:hypothetical protein
MFAELQFNISFSPHIALLETINLDCLYLKHEKTYEQRNKILHFLIRSDKSTFYQELVVSNILISAARFLAKSRILKLSVSVIIVFKILRGKGHILLNIPV